MSDKQRLVRRVTAALVSIFTPRKFDKFRWHILESRFQFIAASCVVTFLQVADLNAFFLKSVLDVKVESKLNFYRLLIISLCGFPTARELYQYVSDPACNRFGSQAWILAAILLSEICVIVKFARHVFPDPLQNYFSDVVKVSWLVASLLYISFLLFYPFTRRRDAVKSKKQ